MAQAIGGWIFLRFINPAILSPDSADVDVPVDSRVSRRTLLLLSKVSTKLGFRICMWG